MYEICSTSLSECTEGQLENRISSSAENRKWEKGPKEGSKMSPDVTFRSDSVESV